MVSSDTYDNELSPLEYARLNGLCRDHLAEPLPLLGHNLLAPPTFNGLSDDSDLPQFDIQGKDAFSTEERLTVSREAARLLASVAKEHSINSINSLVLPLLDCRRTKNLRVEFPLLRTDHESDCKRFAQRKGFELQLKDVKLPLEIVKEEDDEGLTFPSRLYSVGEEIMGKLKVEKLEVRKETMAYLQHTLKYTWFESDEKEFWDMLKTYKRVSSYHQFASCLYYLQCFS